MRTWHVVQTKPSQEVRAAVELTQQNFHVYTPVLNAKPLFPRYIFAEFDRDTDNWGVIRSTRGCCDVLKNGFRPVVVRQEIMEAIMTYRAPQEPADGIVEFAKGQTVRIQRGVLGGYSGLFQGTDKQRMRAFLEVLGNRVEVPILDLVAAL